ncbi:MAG: transposase, partial [Desulfosalsimonas sp.]
RTRGYPVVPLILGLILGPIAESNFSQKKHPELEKKYWKGKLWSPSYFAGSCGGAPVSVIRQYVEQQREK